MITKPGKSEKRTEQELRAHYDIEKSLANKLRAASKSERYTLYTTLYDELCRLVPNHPQLTQKKSPEQQTNAVKKQMQILENFLDRQKSFLEVGPGDCSLAFQVAKIARKVYAVDVSKTLTESTGTPENFELLISNGSDIPVSECSIDFVYSNQLMEHLHPDDAYEQLKNIFATLVPGGRYLCITPSRINGPHDISRYFDVVATGFHLREYTITELRSLFKSAGFTNSNLYVRFGNKHAKFPVSLAVLFEWVLMRLPYKLRLSLANKKPLKALMKIQLVGVKSN